MGQTLSDAAESGNEEVVEEWIARGGDINSVTDAKGCPPLYCACRAGHPRMVQLLLRAHAKLEAREPRCHRTALHAAAKYGMTVSAESIVGEGSRFMILIPAKLLGRTDA